MRRLLTVLTAIGVVLLPVSITGVAEADPDPGEGAEPAFISIPRAHWTVEPAAPDGISAESAAADTIPIVADHIHKYGEERGFLGIRTDYEQRRIVVLWKGNDVPADLRAYAASEPYGVEILFRTGARYSRLELQAARDRLLRDPIAEELTIVTSDLNDDGSGFTVGLTPATHPFRARCAGSLERPHQ